MQIPFVTRRPLLLLCCSVFALIILVQASSSSRAWWGVGHEYITANAIQHLPQPLRGFFEEHSDPLISRSGEEPPGSHWLHLDFYPEFFAGTLPYDREELSNLYSVAIVNSQGTAPWTFESYVKSLTSLMAAAETEQDWWSIISTAGDQAHYIEDLHNPLHLTENYNGQFSGNDGIHARYEGQMVTRHFDDLPIAFSDAVYLPSVLNNTFENMETHFYFLDDILAADDLYTDGSNGYDETYYTGLWEETGTFTQQLFQAATEAVANSWYTAWVNAGMPTTFLEESADFDFDGTVDGADLSAWQTAFGTGSGADADGDSDTDGADFLAWQQQFGGGSALAGTSRAVPEPSTAVLLGGMATAGIFALLRRRDGQKTPYARG